MILKRKMTTLNKRSPVWQFFEICSDNSKFAVCLLCGALISRGGEGYKAGTSAMNNHLKGKHPESFKVIKKEKTAEVPSSPVADVDPELSDANSHVSHSHRRKRSRSGRSGFINLSKLLKTDSSYLMELERRRVEVEEKLANAAVITAEASRIQAEASRMQAEAMVNLVKLLENKQ